VCGLRSEPIQKRLLSEANLTLERAQTLAQGLEAADRNVKSLKGTEAEAIHQLQGSKAAGLPPAQSPVCFCCGRSNHTPADCHFKDIEYHNCGKRGHIAPVCRGKTKPQETNF
jgi:hypothetical protein